MDKKIAKDITVKNTPQEQYIEKKGIYTFHALFLWLKNTYTVWLQNLITPKVVD